MRPMSDMPDRNGDVNNVERLEAEARVVMWQHSQITHPSIHDPNVPRNKRAAARLRLHNEFDAIVDRWAVSRLLAALERISREETP